MAVKVLGMLEWTGKIDEEFHQDYNAKWLLQTDDPLDGPATIFTTSDLPSVGSWWQYGNDNNPWAFCHPSWTANPVLTNEPNKYWIVDTPFSTRPIRRCADNSFQNPIMEPPRISGTFAAFSKEIFFDRFGDPICSSSLEFFSGSEIEFDDSKMAVQIGMNYTESPVEFISPMMQMLNDTFLWGMNSRCIKLSGVRFQRLLFGTCNFFYTVDYDFDIDFKTFDRDIADKGTRVLKDWDFNTRAVKTDPGPDGPADPNNPTHFMIYKDTNRENTSLYLDGAGYPALTLAEVAKIKVEHYEEGDLLALGIPSQL